MSIRPLIFFVLLCGMGVARAASNDDAATAWRLLDYLAVDYGHAVAGGKAVSEAEYAEMQEFSASVETRIAALPARAEQVELIAATGELRRLIADKAEPDRVARQARSIASRLITVYPVPLAPSKVPDLGKGAVLYAEHCSACHGRLGDGHGPAAAGLNPPPIAFADATRAQQRSLFALYQVIGQGLDGTAMASFARLPDEDRWALAFYIGRFAFPESLATRGETLWKQDAVIRRHIPNLEALVQTTPAALADALGDESARAITAYLRRHPVAVLPETTRSLSLALERLSQTVTAYESGDRKAAADAALSAYLDGFEPIEPVLGSRDPQLLRNVEQAMLELRARIGRGGTSDEVRAQAEAARALLSRVELALAPAKASALTAFAGAFTILLREGLEALLIVVAIIAFLRKAQRHEVMPYVHAGWLGALAAGALTWAVATYAIRISGAQREVTEGLGGLFAAVVLISVGIWMHQKSLAGRWQQYLSAKLSQALSQRSAWFLFMLCFVAVYREVFETILFYAAMWTSEDAKPIVGGFLSASAALALIAWAVLGYSARLPIGKFFSVSSTLMAVLAVVLAGKGVAALQEAGWLGVHPVALPRIEWLGLYPSLQVISAQLVALVVLVSGFLYNRHVARRSEVAHDRSA